MNDLKICFLVYGNGGNLKFFWLAKEKQLLSNIQLYTIAYKKCGAIDFALSKKIHSKILDYNFTYNIELLDELSKINPDIIITNWHKIIDNDIVNLYKNRMINLHYSILPAFKGMIGIKKIISEALEKNCQYIGVSTHFVEDAVDDGLIISQAIIKVNNKDQNILINETFQKGAIILLNSVLLASSRIDIFNNNMLNLNDIEFFEFSPNLKFKLDCFTDAFWKELSIL